MVTPKKITLNDTLSPSVVRALFLEGKASRDPVLEKIISDMASPNLDIAIKVRPIYCF